jgi:hypothetical protein
MQDCQNMTVRTGEQRLGGLARNQGPKVLLNLKTPPLLRSNSTVPYAMGTTVKLLQHLSWVDVVVSATDIMQNFFFQKAHL